MHVRRWTPLTFLMPGRYVDTDRDWTAFDLVEWAREDYRWLRDRWNGFLDFAQSPAVTIERNRGDCEDFALVAISWALGNDRDGVGLGWCWELRRPWPTHVIAFDEEQVYSAGSIWRTSVDEWLAESKYVFVLRRRVRQR